MEGSSPATDAARTLWRGRPDAGLYVVREWWPAAAVGFVLGVLGVVWEVMSLVGDYGLAYPVAGGVFLLVGGYGIALRPLLLWRVALDLEYSVDARSVVLRRRRSGRLVWSIATESLPPYAAVASGVTGSTRDIVFFGVPPVESPWGWWRLVDSRSRFACLVEDDVTAAFDALERLHDEPGVVGGGPRGGGAPPPTPQGSRYPAYDPQPGGPGPDESPTLPGRDESPTLPGPDGPPAESSQAS